MPVGIKRVAEPLSFAARTDTPPHPGRGEARAEPILARSRAGHVLKHEMNRYCDGLVRGRSFLIAGHRGAGKTTLVDSVVLEFQDEALEQKLRFKPLPIYVQGPMIFTRRPTEPHTPEAPEKPPSAATSPIHSVAVAFAAAPSTADAHAGEPKNNDDDLERRVLLQVAQGLHQAVAKEYSERFHLFARVQPDPERADELAELAARFQIELTEAPPPSRLREFWSHAGVLQSGLLFNAKHNRGRQQGLREMVALTGVSHVYQRISGNLEEKDEQRSGQARSSETQSGVDAKWTELLKPLGALAAGGTVAAASAAAGNPVWALVLGVLGVLGASLLFRMTSTITRHRERKVDRTFMPDLSTKTLHRVMPELFERLLAAGLAPVFIVDELDKVDDLYAQIHQLLDSMKKLFAERAFTCLLVDRGFFEQLHWREEQERRGGSPAIAAPSATDPRGADAAVEVRPAVYGRNYSYFSHRIFVAYMPEDYHHYLDNLIDTTKADASEALDARLACWVLIHRSQLNALSLNRELESWRSGDVLRLPPDNRIRADDHHRLAVTLQFAIELELADAADSAMLLERPRLQLAAIDAAYFVSRERAEQDRQARAAGPSWQGDFEIDLSESGRDAFSRYLVRRMNLDEDRKPVATSGKAPPLDPVGTDEPTVPVVVVPPLSEEEINWLYGIAAAVARTLCSCTTREQLELRWNKRNAALWAAKGIQPLDGGLYDALLIKTQGSEEGREPDVPPLREVARESKRPASGPGDDPEASVSSFRFRWNTPTFGDPHWKRSLKEIALRSRPERSFVETLDAELRKAMYDERPGYGLSGYEQDQPLRLLADRYQALPTTPPWRAVVSAIETLRHAERGIGNLDTLRSEQPHLLQYVRMLRSAEAAEVVMLMLVLGAALAGLRAGVDPRPSTVPTVPERPTFDAWEQAWTALRDGLGLAAIDLLPTTAQLRTTLQELSIPLTLPASRGSAVHPPATDTAALLSNWPSLEMLSEAVASSYAAGRAAAGLSALTAIHTAWGHVEQRLIAWREGRPPSQPVHGSELICAMRRVGPGAMLPLRIETAGCRIWTRMLLLALRVGPPGGATPAPTLAAHALERLGILNLGVSLQQDMLEELGGEKETTHLLRQYVATRGLWGGSAPAARVVLVLGSAHETMAERWPLPPGQGLVLAVTPAEMQGLSDLLGAWLARLPDPVTVAFEPSSVRGDSLAFEKWLGRQKFRWNPIWLYRDGETPTESPFLIEPKSVDDLWQALPPGSGFTP